MVDKKDYNKKYYEKNKKHIKEYNKKYREENNEKLNKYLKEYYIKNREKAKSYRTNNIEKVRETDNKRNNTKIGKEKRRLKNFKRRIKCKNTDITAGWLLELKENTKFCELCGCEMNDIHYSNEQYNLDHIVPLMVKGKHEKINVRFICRKCNLTRPKNGSDL